MDTSLPTSITTFIGRLDEIEAISHLIDQSSCRLLTLVGPGGVGKTRLAMQAVTQRRHQFRDGTYFIPLQAVASLEAVVYGIAEALNISLYEQEAPRQQLLRYLERRHVLLLLDNFEHLLDAAEFLNDILAASPESKLLVTSREVLNLQGEYVFEIAGLPITGLNNTSVENSDAIRLFAARAGQVKQDFSLEANLEPVVRICQLVSGLPLGIELAAAWTRTLSCVDIADEIERNLDFLSTGLRDVPERHRSMRAVFEHSWAMLNAEEQTVFRALSVFAGAFNREAVQKVTGARLNVLTALIDQSLLQVNTSGHYTVHELLRQYGLEKLSQDSAGFASAQERHSLYYLNLLRTYDPKLKSREQISTLDAIDFVLDNLKTAWNYAAQQQRSDLLLPAIEPLILYYQMRCRLQEGLTAFSGAAEYFAAGEEITYGLLLLGQSWFARFDASQDIARITAITERVVEIITRHAVWGLGAMLYMTFTRHENSPNLIAQNLAAYQAKGDIWGIAWSIHQLGNYQHYLGQQAEARRLLEEAAALFKQIGDRWSATWTQALLGFIAENEGRYDDAYQLYTTRLQSCEAVGDAGGVAWSLQQIAKVSLLLNDPQKARYYCRKSLRVALEISSGNSVNEAMLRIISMYIQTGHNERAAQLCAALLNHVDSNSSYNGQRIESQLMLLKADLSPEAFSRALAVGHKQSIHDLGWALLRELADERPMMPASSQAQLLSERELEVLRLVAAGLSNREIADRLVVTLGTVKKHLNNIYGKLGVERRTEAIMQARQQLLIS